MSPHATEKLESITEGRCSAVTLVKSPAPVVHEDSILRAGQAMVGGWGQDGSDVGFDDFEVPVAFEVTRLQFLKRKGGSSCPPFRFAFRPCYTTSSSQ